MEIFQHILDKHEIRTRGEFVDAEQLAAALGGNVQNFWDEIAADSGFINAFRDRYPKSDMVVRDADCLWLHPVLASVATQQWCPQHAIPISRRLRVEMKLEEHDLEN